MKREKAINRRNRLKVLLEPINEVNSILADWNPLGVGAPLSSDEYRSYVPGIISCIENNGDLIACLSEILQATLGLSQDDLNKDQIDDLKVICKSIEKAYSRSRNRKPS